jgi:hypothetical protein
MVFPHIAPLMAGYEKHPLRQTAAFNEAFITKN